MCNETRGKLLDAAAGIYARKGSRGMTTRAVAQEAGVSELTLFRHFGTKQGLLTALAERFARPEDLDRLFERADTGDLAADLAAIAAKALAAMREVQVLMRVQIMEVMAHPEQQPFLARRPEAAIARLSAFLAQRQQSGQIGPGDTMLMAHIFLAILFARTIGAPLFHRVIPHSEEEVLEEIVRIFVNGVAARPEAE
jgi:AcrR family transcriptional regulator